MRHGADDDSLVKFTPDLARILAAELGFLTVALGTSALLLYLLRAPAVMLLAGGSVVVVGAVGATVFRRSHEVTIGGTWIQGPSGLGGSTTIEIGLIDWKRSGIGRGRCRIVSMGGDAIRTRTGWYSAEELADMARLIRDRADGKRLLSAVS